MILVDLSHTSHTSSQTGVQQVCRQLFAELSKFTEVQAIVFDPYAGRFRIADDTEQSLIQPTLSQTPPQKRGAHWTLSQKLRGYATRALRTKVSFDPKDITAILVPEIINPKIPLEQYLKLRDLCQAPLYAIFHDMIALKMPEFTPAKTVAYFPKYLKKLSHFDGIAAVSQSSRDDLDAYFAEHPPSRAPRTRTIPLGSSLTTHASSEPHRLRQYPQILCVASIEGRKNHLSLLKAVAQLWDSGRKFELELIGIANQETSGPALSLIKALRAAGHPLIWKGPAEQNYLESRYQSCDFTIYPSKMEGFGLPPLESLSYGKPCICSNQSGLAETANDGGCLIPPSMDTLGLAQTIDQLLSDQKLYQTLCDEARARTFRSWNEYALDVSQWITK